MGPLSLRHNLIQLRVALHAHCLTALHTWVRLPLRHHWIQWRAVLHAQVHGRVPHLPHDYSIQNRAVLHVRVQWRGSHPLHVIVTTQRIVPLWLMYRFNARLHFLSTKIGCSITSRHVFSTFWSFIMSRYVFITKWIFLSLLNGRLQVPSGLERFQLKRRPINDSIMIERTDLLWTVKCAQKCTSFWDRRSKHLLNVFPELHLVCNGEARTGFSAWY